MTSNKHLVALCLAALLMGCAEERPTIDRVQPYALKKSFFVGELLQDPADNPEFWTQATLIDVGYGASQFGLFNSTFTQNLSRVRFQITEDYLFARLAYERIEGSDGKGAGRATNDGVIVAAYKIEKHFDVVRDYNPTTGEELNVLNENESDRPWYEREYMRVDWSKNEATDTYDFDTLSLLGVYGGVEYEPMAYDVTDPQDDNAPMFDLKGGYFDVTNKAFAKPSMVDLSHLGWGLDSIPACMLPSDFTGGTAPEGNCNPVELTIRQSFRKVEDHDFEPKHWDGYRFQAAGGFYVERHGYARNYGMSDDKWHRFLNRYQIWQRSHAYADPDKMEGPVECFTPKTTPAGADPHRDEDGDGTEDECKTAGKGSKCDTFRQRCTLPYAQRKTVTLPWYFTQPDSDVYFEATAEATHQWDVALRVAVQTARYAECKETKGKDCDKQYPVYHGQQDENRDAIDLAREVDACRAGLAYVGKDCDALADELGKARGVDAGVIAVAKMPEMIVLCHSPVQADDPAACGDPRLPAGVTAKQCADARKAGDRELMTTCSQALTARLGDLRYHKMNVIYQPQTPSPWGIYSDAEDPLTGETIAASVNVWGWVNDYYSQYYIDIMRYMKGELKAEDVTEGKHIKDWVEAQEKAASGGLAPRLSQAQIDRRAADFTGVKAEMLPQLKAGLPKGILAQVAAAKQKMTGIAASADVLPTSRAVVAARQQAAAGTEFEAALMTPMMQQLHGVQGLPMTPGMMKQVSPLGMANPSLKRDIHNALQQALAKRGMCMMTGERVAAPLSLPGLADKLEAKFGKFNPKDSLAKQLERAEKMRGYLARRFHMSVIAHEMGHSLGLRHNFVSSSDAWQYRPQYWQLRTSDGKVTKKCTDLVQDGTTCVGPRWFDPVTKEERDNLIWMWMHSTVMEYAGEITQDMMGLGVFDFAAVRMFYGDVTTVGEDPTMKVDGPQGKPMLSKMDNFGGILGIRPSSYEAGLNTLLFYHYSEMQDRLKLIQNCKEVNPSTFKPATWDDKKDGAWDPVLDGMMVKVGGKYTRCEQQKVDYVPWRGLRMPKESETAGFYRGGPSVDGAGRLRMPYGFGTDRWADLGNLSVYRHDNGADAYEIFNFLITQQEVGHIFDSYRRGRENFSVKEAVDRTLTRYNAKIRDGAKGLGLMQNIYKELALNSGYDFKTFWPGVATLMLSENIIASSMVFDHFTRMLDRPEAGEHYRSGKDPVLRSVTDDFSQGGDTVVVVPNGATGYYESIGVGGKMVENQLAENQGEYNAEFTINAGSYYEKLYTSMLMTESVDNFISDSRLDFVDPRYRSVSLADLFPDGYRRWLAQNLTDDDELKGPRIVADAEGKPLVDKEMFPLTPIGWTSWWGAEPRVCFPGDGTTICAAPQGPGQKVLHPKTFDNTTTLDPQVGWEQQKFLIAWTLLYLPENQKTYWLDQLRLWELGRDADPGFANRIEFHDPMGRVYVAKTLGKETIFGKQVQRGIAARVLEQANEYLKAAYVTEDGPDLDGDGEPDWYLPKLSAAGQPIVKYDPTIKQIGPFGLPMPGGPGCNQFDSSKCTCSANRACIRLQGYVSVPSYLREAISAYRLGTPSERGVF